jgi:hypothetical protein
MTCGPRSPSMTTSRHGSGRRTGRPFKTVVNDHLRMALAHRRALKALPPFRVLSKDMGGPAPGRSYDDIGALLEDIEDAAGR